MRIKVRGRVLLVGACMLTGALGWRQQSQKPHVPATVSTDLAVTFAAERSQTVPGQCCFWLKGGGVDAAVTFWKGLGITATLTGNTASDVTPGVNVSKIAYLAGPRCTYSPTAVPQLLYPGTTALKWHFPQENAPSRGAREGT
jgi:hypothetical protein